MKTRVMIVSNTLAEGGAERWASFMACHLGFETCEMTLVLFRRQIDYPCPGQVQVECLEHHSTLHTLRTVGRLRQLFAKTEPDVVISNGNYTAQFVGQAVRKVPVRWIARFSGNIEHSNRTLAQQLGWLWLDRNIGRSETLVANSEGVRGDIRQRWPHLESRMKTIRNGVNVQQTLSQAQRVAALKPLIVAAGRLAEQKRPDIFVDAIRLLLRRLEETGQPREVEVVWCGDGPLREKTQNQIESLGLTDIVKLIGFREDLHQWLAKASCFVLTSDHEGSPNVLIEAMAIGTPVISTNCPFGPAELIGDDRGWLVPVGDSPAIAHALKEVLSSRHEAEQRSNAASDWVRGHASSGRVMSDWQSLIASEGSAPTGSAPVAKNPLVGSV
ncbi:alpha-1,4-N-acetyl-D-galactosaminyltransferase [Rubripirellula amarantea]|uniref:Alpha-1,4-N-acetyl-D-galactosaminyltransferase n=1 Tax=Rubripirellula amarantea TaxID=2527999 RepID=A0A5C5WPB5_9BACT|nr:glycosyltransferase [Rubripirellula amarantea]TWT52694.1 alpha-1,4-N-acetyl-D-galactosaminyltransferase [Rubripirellula amarantea]